MQQRVPHHLRQREAEEDMDMIDLQLLYAGTATAPGLNFFSLVDGGQCYKLLESLERNQVGPEFVSLMTGVVERDAKYAGPLLLAHPEGLACKRLKRLVFMEGAKSYASIISTPMTQDELQKHLSWLVDVVHEDGTEWVMRYYDPRILPHWLEVLTSEQRKIALAGIQQWTYLDCRGELQVIDNSIDVKPCSQYAEPMELSAGQVASLMDLSLPYTIIDMLSSDGISELQAIPWFRRYDFFDEQIRKAKTYGVSGIQDLKTYCFLATLLGAAFDDFSLIRSALESGQSFSNKVLSWGMKEWEFLEN